MALSRKSSELNTILSIYAEVKRAQHAYSVAKQFSMSSLSFKKDKRDHLLCDLIKALEASSHLLIASKILSEFETIISEPASTTDDVLQCLEKAFAVYIGRK